jgi:hypothetical protein
MQNFCREEIARDDKKEFFSALSLTEETRA